MYNLQNLPKDTADYLGAYHEIAAREISRLQALSQSEKEANANSHRIGNVDECYRCIRCEIGSWNAWKSPCPV